ncbi:MAG: hypothetical protein DI626_04205, partial [Micavibrio aeruginosavorus]
MKTLRSIRSAVKDVLPRTLLGRSLLILVTPIFLVQIITTYIFFDRHWQTMGNRLAYAVAGEIALIADQIEEDDRPESIDRIRTSIEPALNFSMDYSRGELLITRSKKSRSGFQDPTRESFISQTLSRAIHSQVRRPFDVFQAVDG